MPLNKCALFLLLSCSVLAANTLCACTAVEENGGDTSSTQSVVSSHAHHASHTGHAGPDSDYQDNHQVGAFSVSCTDNACEGCELDALSSERDSGLKWAEVNLPDPVSLRTPQPAFIVLNLASSDPPPRRTTPTLRFDVSLK